MTTSPEQLTPGPLAEPPVNLRELERCRFCKVRIQDQTIICQSDGCNRKLAEAWRVDQAARARYIKGESASFAAPP
jgi:hypothetical protein